MRLRLRPYKSFDAEIISKWIYNEDVFKKWGGGYISLKLR
jgi:hypothetical protein